MGLVEGLEELEEGLEAVEELVALRELGVLEGLGVPEKLEAGAEVFGLEGDVGTDAGGELFVTVGVGGAVGLWLEPVPGLVE